MANSNYIAGRAFEYEVKKAYEKEGYKVLRTAGSHGEFDLVAYRPWVCPSFIQCKIVDNEKAAERLEKAWVERPINSPGSFAGYQVLTVKVRGTRSFRRRTV